ncbi:phage terminase small subunit [Paenibacillus cymbidii]|uniref:phage terminase small subunit n=1 Tax=Paenibacillus cymbidii TaxID=1639034 RepID=UPI00107FEE2D|nr:phage terminase small subunit [Paenibacillus cymbidii]
MSRPRSNNRAAALQIWLKSGRTKKLYEIGDELGVSDVLIRKWKFLDKWDEIPAKRPRGAQKGNKNAVGNNGGAPQGNQNGLKHGLYSKFMPQNEEFQELLRMAQEMDPLDMMWFSVEVAFSKMMWAHRITFVSDKDDMTKVLKRTKDSDTTTEREYELQHANDKQATDIKTFAVASRELRSAIREFLSAAPDNDERRAKLEYMQLQAEKTKAEIAKIKGDSNKNEAEDWVGALKEAAERRKAVNKANEKKE